MKILKKIDGIEIGYIIESGSNANGYWQKYSDGTLKQWGMVIASANLTYADLSFPIDFINTNIYAVSNHLYTGGSGNGGSLQIRNLTTVQISSKSGGYIYSIDCLTPGTAFTFDRKINWIAIGKWK